MFTRRYALIRQLCALSDKRLTGEDYIGIVPRSVVPLYCEWLLLDEEIYDFINLPREYEEQVVKAAKWKDIITSKLAEECGVTIDPRLMKEWHPTKNGPLTPDMVSYGSDKKVWWYLPYFDEETGKTFHFEWRAAVKDRTIKNSRCPFLCENPAVWPGFNDLQTKRPDIAAEWHPTKNGDLTPDQRTFASNDMVWWLAYAPHPVTGEPWPIEWEAKISARTVQGYGWQRYADRHVIKGFNDLATVRPDLAAEWHPTLNGNLTPEDVTYVANSPQRWWLKKEYSPVKKELCELSWRATINSRYHGRGCPYTAASNQKVLSGYNDLASQCPDLAVEWHPEKNGNKTPDMVNVKSTQYVWWKNKDGYEWKEKVSSRVRNC